MRRKSSVVVAFVTLIFTTAFWVIPVTAGEVYVSQNNSGTIGSGTIAKYTTEGVLLNAALITGLSTPNGIAVSGTDLYVANTNNGTIGKYTTSGATVNAADHGID
jgi:sugar lactone lactonase YvrE